MNQVPVTLRSGPGVCAVWLLIESESEKAAWRPLLKAWDSDALGVREVQILLVGACDDEIREVPAAHVARCR